LPFSEEPVNRILSNCISQSLTAVLTFPITTLK
jgi:hypothetical protein